MAVNTDGVLLGAWLQHVQPAPANVLDVGTGCGVIALMAAQLFPDATVEGIEVDAPSACEAKANAEASPWAPRLTIHQGDFKTFKQGADIPPEARYSLLVSNPPFFTNALPAPDKRRHTARHSTEDSLPHALLVEQAARLLAPDGCLAVILPADKEAPFLTLSAAHGLFPNRCTRVQTRPSAPPTRVLLLLRKGPSDLHTDTLSLYNENGAGYSAAYTALVHDFYLWA